MVLTLIHLTAVPVGVNYAHGRLASTPIIHDLFDGKSSPTPKVVYPRICGLKNTHFINANDASFISKVRDAVTHPRRRAAGYCTLRFRERIHRTSAPGFCHLGTEQSTFASSSLSSNSALEGRVHPLKMKVQDDELLRPQFGEWLRGKSHQVVNSPNRRFAVSQRCPPWAESCPCQVLQLRNNICAHDVIHFFNAQILLFCSSYEKRIAQTLSHRDLSYPYRLIKAQKQQVFGSVAVARLYSCSAIGDLWDDSRKGTLWYIRCADAR